MTAQHLLAVISAACLAIGVGLATWPWRQSGLRWTPTHSPRLVVNPLWLIGAGAGAVIGWVGFGSVWFSVLGGGVGAAGAIWLSRRMPDEQAKQQRLMTAEFPLVLGFMALVVESGTPVRFAAQAVAQVVDEPNAARLRGVLARCDVGFSEAEAWRALSKDLVWGDVAAELARCVETGAATGNTLRQAGAAASKTAAAAAIAQARGVGVSSTLPLVSCFLPAFLLVGVVPIIGGLIGGYMANF